MSLQQWLMFFHVGNFPLMYQQNDGFNQKSNAEQDAQGDQ
jgi:hypothetical protein